MEKGKMVQAAETGEKLTLNISRGNVKMGAIPSVSLTPCVSCDPHLPCYAKCYARRMLRYPNVRKAWDTNLEYYRENPDGFFADLRQALKMSAYFRMHVGGDIPDYDYFARLCETVRQAKNCKVLLFTKKGYLVNRYIENGGKIPANLKVIFSRWYDWRQANPYNFPETDIYRSVTDLPKKAITCGGNCSACACRGTGCWTLKKGQTLYFAEH